jgi:RNA polymerase sigma-70 factor, ECF subfamily
VCDNLSMTEQSDNQLVARYLAGDDDAFDALVSRYVRPIYNFTFRIMKSESDAEDATQETFVKAWKHLKRFNERQSFKTWLYAIAHNAAIDVLRKRKEVLFAEISTEYDFAETIADEELLPDELAIKAETKGVLDTALAELPVIYREVLLLRYTSDMTFDEIGEVLGRPLHTVKSQHRRGIAQLKKLLENAPNYQ